MKIPTKEQEFFALLHHIRKQYRTGVHSCNVCDEEGCEKTVVGTGSCADCCEEEIACLLSDEGVAHMIHKCVKIENEKIMVALIQLAKEILREQ